MLLASANPEAGDAVFKKCAACHTAEKGGANKVGPNLWDIVNRPVASHEGFAYSAAMKEFSQGGSVVWDYDHLSNFLHAPEGLVKGTAMSFAGVKKPDERANLIAYLRTLSDSPRRCPKLPLPPPRMHRPRLEVQRLLPPVKPLPRRPAKPHRLMQRLRRKQRPRQPTLQHRSKGTRFPRQAKRRLRRNPTRHPRHLPRRRPHNNEFVIRDHEKAGFSPAFLLDRSLRTAKRETCRVSLCPKAKFDEEDNEGRHRSGPARRSALAAAVLAGRACSHPRRTNGGPPPR